MAWCGHQATRDFATLAFAKVELILGASTLETATLEVHGLQGCLILYKRIQL